MNPTDRMDEAVGDRGRSLLEAKCRQKQLLLMCGPGRLQVCSSHRVAVTGRGRETSSTQPTEGGVRGVLCLGLAYLSQIGRALPSSFQASLLRFPPAIGKRPRILETHASSRGWHMEEPKFWAWVETFNPL